MRRSIHSPPYIVLRELLTSARLQAGVTQEQLAARLGRPQSYVAKYESGDRRLDVVEFVEACEALNLRPEGLLTAVMATLSKAS